jgi:hypothetical protein
LVLGASGSGKSVMTAAALVEEIRQTRAAGAKRPAYVLVDPKGDLIQLVLHGLAGIESLNGHDILDDVVYLDPFGAGGFPLNLNRMERGGTPLDITAMQLAALVGTVSTATGTQKHLGMGARQQQLLQEVLLGALDTDHPDSNILWALDALTEPNGMKALAAITKSARARQFLLSARLSDELMVSCASRLRTAFAATGALERLVSADTSIQFRELVAPGRITLIDLGRPTGGLSTLQAFWTNLLVRLLIQHLLERPSPWAGHHARVVVDESQVVAPVLADMAEQVLTTGRSRGVSLVTMSQGTALIHKASDTLLDVLLTNTPTKFVGRLGAVDAQLLAKSLTAKQGVDESTQVIRNRFISAVTNAADRQFFLLEPGSIQRFRSLDVDLDGWEQAAERRVEKIREVKSRFALPEGSKPRRRLSDVVPRAPRRGGQNKPKVVRSPWG